MSEIIENNTPESIETDGIPEVSFTVEVYNTVQAPIDSTLSVSGMAADAAATGDAIDAAKQELQEDIDGLSDDIAALANTFFPVGCIYVSTSASAPTFGGNNWQWQEIMLPVTQGDLIDGARSYVAKDENDTPGTLHFWMRIANTGV